MVTISASHLSQELYADLKVAGWKSAQEEGVGGCQGQIIGTRPQQGVTKRAAVQKERGVQHHLPSERYECFPGLFVLIQLMY